MTINKLIKLRTLNEILKIMKNLIYISFALLSFTFLYSHNNDDVTETHKHEVISSIDKDESFLINEIDCPECYGTLQRTYQIEYCVGVKCRTRELYRCNMNRDHEFWVYTD